MLVAVISDIHANLEAFEAVIADWGHVDAVWCLGDVVGYGPDPAACLRRLREMTDVVIAGNHDWAATGRLSTLEFNEYAAAAAAWTRDQLTSEECDYLDQRELVVTAGEFTLAHGSPRDPIWEYIVSDEDARENFAYFEGPACLVGHSHIAIAFSTTREDLLNLLAPRTELPRYDQPIKLGSRRHIVNVGSVGQPRDGNPRARYVLLDTDQRVYVRRQVAYDVTATQEKMRRAGLPAPLWQRLSIGR